MLFIRILNYIKGYLIITINGVFCREIYKHMRPQEYSDLGCKPKKRRVYGKNGNKGFL